MVDDSKTDGPSSEASSEIRDALLPGENQLVWVIWLTYGAFYFCRTNISAAVPGLRDELGYDETQIGMVLGALKLTYGFGQFVNGQLSERFSPRVLLAIGMIGSALLNIVFGVWTALYFLLFVWACNGYCQSLGWTPCMRVMSNWIPARRRGRSIGLVGTGYQLTAALTLVVAAWSAQFLGWRGALYVPAFILLSAAAFMLMFLRESPDRHPFAGESSVHRLRSAGDHGSFTENLLLTLTNPALWLLAVALGLLNACRYGFLDWGLTYLLDVQPEAGIGKSGLKSAVLPIGGIAGSVVAGWATDRFFGSRRAPVIVALLVALGVMALCYDSVARSSVVGTVILLTGIGFAIYGPQVLLVGTAPADLARRGTAAAAAGFVNFMGYMGAFAGDTVTGWLTKHHDWSIAIRFWAGCAFGSAIAAAFLWNATARDEDQERSLLTEE